MTVTRKRRTKEEINAGMTREQKKDGMTLDDLKALQSATMINEKKSTEKRSNLADKGRKLLESTKSIKADLPPIKERPVFIEKQVTKEVRILDKDDERSIRDIFQEEIANCSWEWKEVSLDKEFRRTILDQLGKDGWKFAFILDRSVTNPKSNKPDSLLFHRVKK